METKLQVVYANVKSFYEKATVKTDGQYTMLFSYGTFICELKDGKINAFSDNMDHYTATTMRHLNEFLQQHDIEKFTKAKWTKYMSEHIALPMA